MATVMPATGYDCDFLDREIAADFECPLCLYVTRQPALTSCCGQHFCEPCIDRVVSKNKPCPFCKAASGFSLMLDKKQERRIMELKVQCSMKERGCMWVGELRDLRHHLSAQGDCTYSDVVCTNGCAMTMPKCMLIEHLRDSCPKRKSVCEHCGFASTYEGLCNHWQFCSKYPLPCPNKCSEGLFLRCNLEQHLQLCPLNPVACEFSHAGCNTRISRKDLATHMEESVHKHLNLVMNFTAKSVRQLQYQLENKDTEIQELKEKIERLEMSSFPMPLPPVEFIMPHLSKYELGCSFDSPTFLTHPMGNRIKLKIVSAKSDVMSGFVIRMPGPFDSNPEATMKCYLSIKLLNQIGDHNHIEKTSRLEFKQLYKMGDEVQAGWFQIADYASLKEPKERNVQYVKDDCLRFQVAVKIIET